MIVEWRAKAREDRNNIFDYIAEDNPTAALELDDEIEQKTDALPEHPELYRRPPSRHARNGVGAQLRARLSDLEANQDYRNCADCGRAAELWKASEAMTNGSINLGDVAARASQSAVPRL